MENKVKSAVGGYDIYIKLCTFRASSTLKMVVLLAAYSDNARSVSIRFVRFDGI